MPRMCSMCPGTCRGPAGSDGVYRECAVSPREEQRSMTVAEHALDCAERGTDDMLHQSFHNRLERS